MRKPSIQKQRAQPKQPDRAQEYQVESLYKQA